MDWVQDFIVLSIIVLLSVNQTRNSCWSDGLTVLDSCWWISQPHASCSCHASHCFAITMCIYIHLLIHVRPSLLPSIHPSINKCCTSSQTHFQAASQRPRSLSSYTRERCGRDPISSSDWISGSRRGTQELLTIPPPHYPPFLCLFVSLVLDLFLLWTPVFPLTSTYTCLTWLLILFHLQDVSISFYAV